MVALTNNCFAKMVAEVSGSIIATSNGTNTNEPDRIETYESDQDDVEDQEDDEASLIIPITSSGKLTDQFIEIFPEEMKEIAVTTLMKVLQDENANKSVWADAALLYMRRKQPRDSLALLQHACENEDMIPDGDNNNGKEIKVRMLASTGIAHLAVEQTGGAGASNNTKQRQVEKEEIRQLADQKFTRASKIDTFFPMTWIGRGMLNLSMDQKERREQAKSYFQTTLKQCGPVMPALLGMGAVLYNEGDYKGAQEKYADAIRRYPMKSGAATRVGFGLACYKLGQVDRAKAAFARALDIDSENVQAMVGAAVLEMAALDETQNDFSSRTEKAIKMMSMANLLDHSNAMVQNHLANHYFWKWTPVTGTVNVTQGSTLIKSSQIIPLEPGEPIRIGTKFEVTIRDDPTIEDNEGGEDGSGGYVFRINKPWKDNTSSDLKVWKKDYERVIDLAKGAYSSTSVQEIQAESLFLLARVYHVREDIENAHKCYERACKLAPQLNPARFGLAQTLIVKEEYNDAMNHLRQLVTTSVNATDAYALLGLLETRSGTTKTLEDGLLHIRKAIELDPVNPELVILEAIALQQNTNGYNKSLERYNKAVELMKIKGNYVPYNILNNIGVLCHETKKINDSLESYQLALIALDDEYGTAGRAHLNNKGIHGGYIRHKENEMFFSFIDSKIQAEQQEAGTTDNKTNALKLVGVTGSGDGENGLSSIPFVENDIIRIDDTIETVIKKIITSDNDVILELQDSIELPQEQEDNIEKENDVEMEGNDDNDHSKKTKTKKLFSIFVLRENKLLEIPEATTVAFNIARLHETSGRTMAAIELHKAITIRNPAYVNSYLRLACIAVDCGCLNECAEWLKIAAISAPGNSEVLTLIGNLHLSLCDWKPAQKVFDGLMAQKISTVEAYSSLSLGNIYFATLHVKEDRYAKHLQYAADFYKRILTKDPLNAYAANGIGTVLAEKAEIFKAKEIFNRVREVSGDSIADSLLNLGHIYLAQKKHPEALQMYKSYLKKAEDGTTPITSKSRLEDIVDVLLYISFAYFDWARHTELFNDVNAAPADGRYKKAMEHLRYAISKRSKKEVILKYNLCMTKLQAANCVLQKLTRNIPRTVEEVVEALAGLEESLVVVETMLAAKEKGDKVNIRSQILEDYIKHCRANIASAKSHLEDERKRAEEERVEQECRRLASEAAIKEAALKDAIKKQEETKKQEERDQRADAKMRKVEELTAGWTQSEEPAQNEKSKKGKRDRNLDDQNDFVIDNEKKSNRKHGLFDDSEESDVDDPDTDDDNDNKAKKQKVNQNDLFGDSDDENVEKAKVSKNSKPTETGLFGDSDDDVEFESKPSNDNKTAKPTVTGADLFGDSDSEGESDEELLGSTTNKRPNETSDAGEDEQSKKKRRVLEEE